MMRASGCRRVYLGLESGSQATLDLMQKQMTVEQGERAVTVYNEAGIEVAAFFIVGYPGETASDIEETFALPSTSRWPRSLSTCRCRCRDRGYGSAWAAATKVATGRTKTK